MSQQALYELLDATRITKPFSTVINGAAPGANTDILPADFTPSVAGILGVSVSFGAPTVFNLVIKHKANPDLVLGFQQSSTLTANNLFSFPISVDPEASYNFQIESDGAVNLFQGHTSITGASI